MSEFYKGLYQKYEVTKIFNPSKKIDALVLEFDDTPSRLAIRQAAEVFRRAGFAELARDLDNKCDVWDIEMDKRYKTNNQNN